MEGEARKGVRPSRRGCQKTADLPDESQVCAGEKPGQKVADGDSRGVEQIRGFEQ